MADGLIQGQIGAGTIVMNNTWSLLATNPPPDWSEYVKAGIHKPSKLMVREINEAEANKSLSILVKVNLHLTFSARNYAIYNKKSVRN